ncbi:MAG: aminopeptidase [Desulfovibrionaceae bacterium]
MSVITSTDLENYAEVLTWALRVSRNEKIKNGEAVVVRFDYPAMRLVEALYSRLVDEHLNPVLRLLPTPLMEGEHYLNTSFGQLVFQEPGETELYAQAAGVITIYSPLELTHLAGIDPRTIMDGRRARVRSMSALERRRRSGRLGWTSCVWPSAALANAAGLPLEDYEEQFLRACWLNMPSPVDEWRRLRRELGEVSEWLDSLDIRSLHVESEHLDFTLEPGDNRRFRAVTGANVPSCEIFVSPDCRTMRGHYYADQPSVYLGRVVMGVELDFDGGVAARADALTNGQFLQQQLYLDGGARRVGEFSLTDKRFSRVDHFMAHTILDENHAGEQGNCHIALGASLPATFSGPPEILTPEMESALGFNASQMHWDLVNTESKRVTAKLADGTETVVYEQGIFQR